MSVLRFKDPVTNEWKEITTIMGPEGPAGVDGKDYVLTEADKQEIAGMVEVTGGGDHPVQTGTGTNSVMSLGASQANGTGSVALGTSAASHKQDAIALGQMASAEGLYSVAIGNISRAAKSQSVAIGPSTVAAKSKQVVIGAYNAEDSEANFVIGNGSSSTDKKNAMTIDADNVAHFPGNIKVGANDEEVATKAYVDANAGGGAATAADINYSNAETQIEATTVQDAIDHLFETAIDATYVENLGYQTEEQVNALITTALGNIGVAEEGSY